MSWAEVKKAVNSDVLVPLNHLIWLIDYKTFGQESYVFNTKRILHELYTSPCAFNDKKMYEESWKWLSENKNGLLKPYMKNFAPFIGNESDVVDNIGDILINKVVVKRIIDMGYLNFFNNSGSMDLLRNSSTAKEVLRYIYMDYDADTRSLITSLDSFKSAINDLSSVLYQITIIFSPTEVPVYGTKKFAYTLFLLNNASPGGSRDTSSGGYYGMSLGLKYVTYTGDTVVLKNFTTSSEYNHPTPKFNDINMVVKEIIFSRDSRDGGGEYILQNSAFTGFDLS